MERDIVYNSGISGGNNFGKEKRMKGKTFLVAVTACLCLINSIEVIADCPRADLTGDCFVDLQDFAIMASEWLTGGPSEPNGMVWVYIEDPGIPGHEGFLGEISKYETTNAQYCRYLNSALAEGLIIVNEDVVFAKSDTGHYEPYFRAYHTSQYSQISYDVGAFSVRSRNGHDMSNHPVVMVSWYGATAFCDYYGYRLPTEWEWQAVADYDGSFIYGCGIEINQDMANYYYANPLALYSSPFTSPAGYYQTYGYGMCDMAGNVWEWTNSIYFENANVDCIIRGGSWDESANVCSVGYRLLGLDLTTINAEIGFRVCR